MIARTVLETGRLTTPEYWDGYLRKFRLPRANDPRRMPWRAIDRVLAPALPSAPADVLEVGCAASAWLPYFASRGYRCFGVDYSAMGCSMAVRNLAHYGSVADVWCADLFRPAHTGRGFDVVFSNGLVEHFEDTAEVLRQLRALARPGGLVVTLVPNLAGWAGKGFRRQNPRAFAEHVVIEPEDLRRAHENAALEIVRIDHCGVWFPYLWSARPRGASRAVTFALKCAVHGTARPIWGLTALTGRYPEGRAMSPYVLAIARRPVGSER